MLRVAWYRIEPLRPPDDIALEPLSLVELGTRRIGIAGAKLGTSATAPRPDRVFRDVSLRSCSGSQGTSQLAPGDDELHDLGGPVANLRPSTSRRRCSSGRSVR